MKGKTTVRIKIKMRRKIRLDFKVRAAIPHH